MKLPKVELRINPEILDTTGIEFISIVEDPAIEVKGIAFHKEMVTENVKFAAVEDKQIIVGPLMIPNFPIYRAPCPEYPDGYYAFYTEETVRNCSDKFNRLAKTTSLNVDHSHIKVDGFVMESWIVESKEYDKSKMYGFDLPIGTWFIAVKITDKNFWETEVKEGKCSFSIEGLMAHQDSNDNFSVEDMSDEDLKEIAPTLWQILKDMES